MGELLFGLGIPAAAPGADPVGAARAAEELGSTSPATSSDHQRRHLRRRRLTGCTANAGAGDYTCAFTHDFPVASHRSGQGRAHFTVAPADRPGWFMTVLEDCD